MDLQTIIASDIKLPATPQVLPKLQKLLRDDDCSIFDIMTLVKVDTALTTEIIKLANSAYFGAFQPSENLEEAVSRLGFTETFKVVAVAAAKQAMGGPLPVYNLIKGELLKESIATAVTMTSLCPHKTIEQLDTAYTVGLLHGLGKVIVNAYYSERGIEVYAEAGNEGVDYTLERKILGFDNAQVGAGILKKWKFAEDIIAAIEHQFIPSQAGGYEAAATLLKLSRDATPFILAEAEEEHYECVGNETLLEAARLDKNDYSDGIIKARTVFAEVKEMLGNMD